MFPISARPSVVVHSHKSKAPQLYAAAITTYVLAVIAVALRFWARRLTKAVIRVDDWTVTVALFVTTGYLVNVIVSLHQGFGEHYELLSNDYAINFGKNLYSEQVLYFAVIGLVKISMLAFYWRLFSSSKPIRISCYILGAVVACWEIGAILVTVFQCVPISAYWNKGHPSRCIDERDFFLGYSIPNILTDFALLLLPVSSIWHLQMRTSHKIGLAGTFTLGSFVTVISIVRLLILLKPNHEFPDVDYNYVSLSGWSIAESNMAIVAGVMPVSSLPKPVLKVVTACLPSLRPLFPRPPRHEPQPLTRSTSCGSFSRSWPLGQTSEMVQPHEKSTIVSENQHRFTRLPDEVYGCTDQAERYGNAIWSGGYQDPRDEEDLEMQRGNRRTREGIKVKSEVVVQSSPELRILAAG